MKTLIILLLVSPLSHAEHFLEFTHHTHPDGIVHYTNIPNNQGSNFINITGSADMDAYNAKQQRVKAYYEDKKALEAIKKRSFNMTGKVIQVGKDHILLSRGGDKVMWVELLSTVGYVDGQSFNSTVIPIGTKQYVAVSGATKTVSAYQEVNVEN